MRSVQEYPTYLVEIAFKEDPTVYELLTIAVAACVLGYVLEIDKPLLRRLTLGRSWLRSSCEREHERGMKVSLEKLGLN